MILWFLLAVNLFGAGAVLLDKRRAQRGAWRVPERTLFAFCLCGGCPGVYLAMHAVHHKTRHKRFMLGIPTIFIIQIVIFICIYYYLHRGALPL